MLSTCTLLGRLVSSWVISIWQNLTTESPHRIDRECEEGSCVNRGIAFSDIKSAHYLDRPEFSNRSGDGRPTELRESVSASESSEANPFVTSPFSKMYQIQPYTNNNTTNQQYQTHVPPTNQPPAYPPAPQMQAPYPPFGPPPYPPFGHWWRLLWHDEMLPCVRDAWRVPYPC